MIDGITLKNAIISGANNITKNKNAIDDLNIFPVPDGDTGTNMSMTINSAVLKLKEIESSNAGEIAKITASEMLKGARGNSGVILSLLFRGFSKGLAGKEEFSGAEFAQALEIGVKDAYEAVMNPTEGTILTVARRCAESGNNFASSIVTEENTDKEAENKEVTDETEKNSENEITYTDNNDVKIIEAMYDSALDALAQTPKLLHVLKKAGVVDAGGKGFCTILEGMLSVFKNGVILESDHEAAEDLQGEENDYFRSAAAEFDDDITFTYCTEYIVGRDTDSKANSKSLRSYLEKIGDCVVVVDNEEIIKVHVHTESPGLAIQEALQFGQLLTVKVENMKEQHRKAAEAQKLADEQASKEQADRETAQLTVEEPVKEVGFVAVASGDGLEELFKDLGCNRIVKGGQSMNPSTEDIRKAVLATGAKNIFVLPNNKNIVMAAQQVVPMITDRKVIVLPTRTIPQGIGAMVAYDPDLSVDGNKQIMLDAASDIATGQVTFAARDSEFGSTKIKEGEIIALDNGKLTLTEKTPEKAAYKLIKNMIKRDTSFITVLYGEDTSEEAAGALENQLQSKYGKDIEITFINGGQPIYFYIISIE